MAKFPYVRKAFETVIDFIQVKDLDQLFAHSTLKTEFHQLFYYDQFNNITELEYS